LSTPESRPPTNMRLGRLRELAASAGQRGSEQIKALIEQEGDGRCPRFAGIAEHEGNRTILAADSEGELAHALASLVSAEPPHSAQALIDLDSGERRSAQVHAHITFQSQRPAPSALDLASAAISNVEAVAASVSAANRDCLTSAVEDILSLLAMLDPQAAERLESSC
jgi:hypothetical protein